MITYNILKCSIILNLTMTIKIKYIQRSTNQNWQNIILNNVNAIGSFITNSVPN